MPPQCQARPKLGRPLGRQVLQQVVQLGRGIGFFACSAATPFATRLTAQQAVKFFGHQFTVGVQLAQKKAAIGKTQCLCNPGQVIVARGQHMGLLVVQILDAVLHATQKNIGPRQSIGRILRHQPGIGQALKGTDRGARAQLGELPAAYHLQQLHGELNFADAAARHLHIVGALGVAGTALGRVLADLPMQRAQRVKHTVVQVTPENKWQHRTPQGTG